MQRASQWACGELTDEQLAARCRDGDRAAWGELVDRFSRYVWAIAIQGYRLSEADAEDVTQETFAKAYKHLHRLRDDAALRPWIGQLARRLAVDRIRARRREHLTDEPPEPEPAGSGAALLTVEEAMDVRAAMTALPAHCREILDLFFARDESYETIARLLQIPSGTIASRISRCLKRLREALGERRPVSP